ncbi:DUF1330 domain-containing protein, partial [Vibrio sp. CUB2]|uniref:DUF1330 domain-containing protein n=1 Tax=Vibrio sp. CUB2 TaxID=2315233 RepID=UPI0012D9B34E
MSSHRIKQQSPPTYLYIQFKIQDMEAFNEYAERVSETTQIYGGQTIAINKSPT